MTNWKLFDIQPKAVPGTENEIRRPPRPQGTSAS